VRIGDTELIGHIAGKTAAILSDHTSDAAASVKTGTK